MSFLSKLFSRGLTRDRWYVKVDLLTELSEIARKYWVREWAAIAGGGHPDAGSAAGRAEVRLPERADTALRVLQAHLTARFLREHEYLPPDDQSDFGGMLLGSMVGEQTPEAAALVERYAEAGGNDEALFARVAVDLAEGLGAGEAETARIRDTLPEFTTEQHYITALCFGDTEMVNRLRAQIEEADRISHA